jgi:23S rRNA (cytidine1920-2'-O)/16S rRNA (cytidine1409-2'-O)-methyltransferase
LNTSKPKTEERKPAKTRLDQLLVTRALADTRAKAQALILAGRVVVDGRLVDKAGTLVAADAEIVLKEPPSPYVSRGGDKLAAALDHFGVDPQGKVCLDAGASTGGFSHVLLLRGAARVYAVDVGYGQLDPIVRNDPRVVVLERSNLRTLPPEAIPEAIDLATLDLSFISLTLVLPKIVEFMRLGGKILALVKPQFEVGKDRVGKGGVVRDPALQQEAVDKVARAVRQLGLRVSAGFPSPLKGPKGNQEYFLHVKVPKEAGPPPDFIDKPSPSP